MAPDPHPALRAAADVLYLVNEGVHAVLLGGGEAMSRAFTPPQAPPPPLRAVRSPTGEHPSCGPGRRRPSSS